MRKSKTLQRLRANEMVKICALSSYMPFYPTQAANSGFDCIWMDHEHNSFSTKELGAIAAYSHLADIDLMFRPPTTERTWLYRYLEEGITGLMIPFVSTSEYAERLVQATKFPPLGNRGLDGSGLDSDFYTHDTDTYIAHQRQETFLIVQIETPEAVNNADAIAAVQGVEGLFVGPADLGLRVSDPNVSFSLEEAIVKVANAATTHGKAWGLPVRTIEQAQLVYDQGARLIAYGGDKFAVFEGLRETGKQLETICNGKP